MGIFKKNDRAETIKAYKRLFESRDGKLVLKDLMKSLHFTHSTFDPIPSVHAFREGQRDALMRILRTTEINVQQFEEAMKAEGL